MIPSFQSCQVHPGADDDGSNSLCVESSRGLTFEEQKLPPSSHHPLSKATGTSHGLSTLGAGCWMTLLVMFADLQS